MCSLRSVTLALFKFMGEFEKIDESYILQLGM